MNIWFNKGFSNLGFLIEDLRQHPAHVVVASHIHPKVHVALAADQFLLEPDNLSDDAYLQFCLETCRKYAIEIFFPTRKLVFLSAHAAAFSKLGTTLSVAGPSETLQLLDNKLLTYREGVAGKFQDCLPTFFHVTDIATFKHAHAFFTAEKQRFCLKPCVGVFGDGFKIFTENGNAFAQLFSFQKNLIDMQTLEFAFASTTQRISFLAMPFLEDEEWSLDCLAKAGQLQVVSCRRKDRHSSRVQRFVDNPALLRITQQLATHFQLNGIFNAQFKYHQGQPYLLEINARCSGGLHYSLPNGRSLLREYIARFCTNTVTDANLQQLETHEIIRTDSIQHFSSGQE